MELFRAVCEEDRESVVMKVRDSPYRRFGDTTPRVKVKFREYSQARDRGESL